MVETWSCVLLCEGTSDSPLSGLLEQLIIGLRPACMVTFEVLGHDDYVNGLSVRDKISVIDRDRHDLVFVHRDADRVGAPDRIKEIAAVGDDGVVPVVPVRMTEAWILADLWDQPDFRRWASREGFRLAGVESRADPKDDLRRYLSRGDNVLLKPSTFGRLRATLLREVNPAGSVSELSAWKDLVGQTQEAMRRVRPYLFRAT